MLIGQQHIPLALVHARECQLFLQLDLVGFLLVDKRRVAVALDGVELCLGGAAVRPDDLHAALFLVALLRMDMVKAAGGRRDVHGRQVGALHHRDGAAVFAQPERHAVRNRIDRHAV